MGYRPYVHVKHEVKYADTPTPNFNWKNLLVHDFLTENGVDILGSGECGELPDWEMDKDQLRAIPESAFAEFKERDGVTEDDLRRLVKELLEAKTGQSSYISWF